MTHTSDAAPDACPVRIVGSDAGAAVRPLDYGCGGGRGRRGLIDYTVPVQDGEVVLDAVHRLQATQASDLAVRWNCKAGKCGSCSAEINGHPKLMCMTRLSALPDGPVTVTPLRTFPIIRDLVTDVSFNYAKAQADPVLRPASRPGGW